MFCLIYFKNMATFQQSITYILSGDMIGIEWKRGNRELKRDIGKIDR